MTYHSTTKRTQRVLTFLGALEHPELFALLSPYGFDEAVIEQGWRLLRAHARARPAPRPLQGPAPDVVAAIDAWENRWFPIADASLRHRHPEIHRTLFLNLARTRGLNVVIAVGSFVQRVRELQARADPQSQAARAQLERRGLTDATLEQAEALLAELQRPACPPSLAYGRGPTRDAPSISAASKAAVSHAADAIPAPRTLAECRAVAREAEQAMWRWYREWSQISRAVIQDREWLRHLGFGAPGRPRTTGVA